MQQILSAITEFIQYHTANPNLTPASLSQSLRDQITNHLRPDHLLELCDRLQANHMIVKTQKLLRCDAIFGQPSCLNYQLNLNELAIVLSLTTLALSRITPLDHKTDAAKLIRNWIHFDIGHNQEADRLGQLCAINIQHLQNGPDEPYRYAALARL